MASNAKLSFDAEELGFLLEELYDIRNKWRYLGLQLQISPSDLNDIAQVKKDDSADCLLELLMRWFQTKNPTCESLLKALKSKSMESHSIAERIQAKYQRQNIPESTTTQGPETNIKDSSKGAKAKRPLSPSREAGAPTKAKRRKLNTLLPDSFEQTDFVQRQPPDRLCIKCSRVPLNPQRSVCCNRLYCKPCADKTKKCSNKTHKEEIQYSPDKELSTKIYKLRIKCKNKAKGCTWEGEVFRLKTHLPVCPHEQSLSTIIHQQPEVAPLPRLHINVVGKIPPSFADEDFTRNHDEYHCNICQRIPSTPLRSECCPSVLFCETCGQKDTHCSIHIQPHTLKRDKALKSIIQNYVVKCPYRCGWKDHMKKLKQHIPIHTSDDSKSCEERNNEPATPLGDSTQATPLDNSTLATPLDDSTEQPTLLKFVSNEEATQDQSMNIHSTNGPEEDNEQYMVLESPSTTEPVNAQIEALSMLNYQLQQKLDQLQVESEACAVRVPPLTFHIPLLSSYKSPCFPWKSHSFYTHPLGYRVNLQLQVDSTGALCIGLAPEEGVNDDHLRWSVSGKMVLRFLNQNADRDHHEYSTKFKLQKSTTITLKRILIPTTEPDVSYTSGDSLYFRLVEIKLEEESKPWLIS